MKSDDLLNTGDEIQNYLSVVRSVGWESVDRFVSIFRMTKIRWPEPKLLVQYKIKNEKTTDTAFTLIIDIMHIMTYRFLIQCVVY